MTLHEPDYVHFPIYRFVSTVFYLQCVIEVNVNLSYQ